MAVVAYNGVSLPYPHITQFEQQAQYEDVGGVDWYCTRFDIKVQCVFNAAYALSMNIDPENIAPGAQQNAATLMKYLRAKLLQPRRKLEVYCNGVSLIPEDTAGDGTVDVKNGPQPQSCVIVDLQNETFLITFHVVAHYWENNTRLLGMTANRPGHPVLFNRWTETVEMDECMRTKRTREGKYMIRSDNDQGRQADQLRRDMAVLGCPDGFNRKSSRYRVSADGLAIEYAIVDEEVFKHPPKPAFQARGEYLETSTANGAMRFGECWVRLKGAQYSSQARLIVAAIQIVATKLWLNGALMRTNFFEPPGFRNLQFAALKVGLYENVVEYRAKAMIKMRRRGGPGVGGFTRHAAWVHTPLSEPKGRPEYWDHGTAGMVLQAARYYDPSITGTKLTDPFATPEDVHVVPSDLNHQLSEGEDIGAAGVNPEN